MCLAIWVTPALAEDDALESLVFEWEAPVECPQADAVRSRIRALVPAGGATPEAVRARGHVSAESTSNSFQLVLETEDGARTFQRTVHAGSCTEIADAGALIIALVLAPSLQRSLESPVPSNERLAPETVHDSAAPVISPAAPARKPVPALSERRVERARVSPPSSTTKPPLVLALAGKAIVDTGSLPRVALGGSPGVSLERNAFKLEAFALFFPDARKVIATEPERGAELGLIAGGLRGCYALRRTSPSVQGCGALEAGRLEGRGFRTTWVETKRVFWLAGGLGVSVSERLGSALRVRAELDGVLPVTRPEFLLTNLGPVYRPAVVVGRLGAGLELAFE